MQHDNTCSIDKTHAGTEKAGSYIFDFAKMFDSAGSTTRVLFILWRKPLYSSVPLADDVILMLGVHCTQLILSFHKCLFFLALKS